MKSDLEKIIRFVDKLSEVNTDGVDPLIYLSDEVSVLREDEIKTVISQVEALKMEISSFIEQINTNSRDSINDLKNGIRVVNILEASKKSLKKNKKINL